MTTPLDVVMVDWLGRGGIAQSSMAWARLLIGHPRQGTRRAAMVTRLGRELRPSDDLAGLEVMGVPDAAHPLVSHILLTRKAAEIIRERHPSTVIVQNYVVPMLELSVGRAAQAVSARLVLVVHDHHLHPGSNGSHRGLRRLLAMADVVVCHTSFVAEGVQRISGRSDIEILPLPLLLPDALGSVRPTSRLTSASVALHFGVVGKPYKGLETVLQLGAAGVPGWSFSVLGTGAPDVAAGVATKPGFLPAEQLIAALAASDATLLPYTYATQSGAVPLAHACGSVVVASGVGGLPEQLHDGATGIVVPPGTPLSGWAEVLSELSDGKRRSTLAAAARASLVIDQDTLRTRVPQLVA
jgi:glycosyltransferase involved in cell wall biosynthesis